MYYRQCPFMMQNMYPAQMIPCMRSMESSHMENSHMANDSNIINPHMTEVYRHVMMLKPLVQYSLKEGKKTGTKHATLEVVLIAYLMGKGYDYERAHAMVEEWEIDEKFPGEDAI
jgi:hypothetical protein